ncbi:hypothetical protein BDW02DRAFT_574706 [Decorospora gaudefroyi]|uniref:WD40 repeat-like protein n=1 Tax=Decorospora gaudefroyi TaxID=184978 RepID=A0A6A5JX25_9PLEO|nr:hypothetical protein BDW02DRAFT_574706 [Decorospora gaudefroyi]
MGINVRCLASTRVLEDEVQEKETSEEDEKSRDIRVLEGAVEEESRVRELEEVSEQSDDVTLGGDIEENEPDSPMSSTSSSSSSTTDTDDSSDTTLSDPLQHNISCVYEAQLSPDGTCVFTTDFARQFSVYPIDRGILSNTTTRRLEPYASFQSPSPIWAFAVNPLFNLQDASSTTVLVSRRDSYITLHNALADTTQTYDVDDTQPVDISKPLASYKLVNNLTEAIIAPLSLAYSNSRAHFFAGEKDRISVFDLTDTDEPLYTIDTIPAKRNKLKGGGRGFKGWVSALSLSPPSSTAHDGLLAVGTWSRYVGIYDPASGRDVTQFALPGTVNGRTFRNRNFKDILGNGVSSLKWSPCGKYLYIAERNSDVLLLYDVRKFSLGLAHCVGRNALTNQKLGFDVCNTGDSPYDIEGLSHEVWAGGTDGCIRVWRDPYAKEGAVEADEVVKAVPDGDGTPVVGTLLHPSGSLAIAACGVLELSEDTERRGGRECGGLRPGMREWGSVDILGLG